MRLTSKFAVFALLVGAAAFVRAEEEPTTKPSKEKGHGPRLVQPYSKMTTLSRDDKEKIAAIHKKSVEEQKVIAAKEEADIMALLTPPQKAELEQIKDESQIKSKGKEADRKAGPTTEPAK